MFFCRKGFEGKWKIGMMNWELCWMWFLFGVNGGLLWGDICMNLFVFFVSFERFWGVILIVMNLWILIIWYLDNLLKLGYRDYFRLILFVCYLFFWFVLVRWLIVCIDLVGLCWRGFLVIGDGNKLFWLMWDIKDC